MNYATYMLQCLVTMVCAALGAWAFGVWQNSPAAGFFMFFVLDAVGGISLGLTCIAYKPHGE